MIANVNYKSSVRVDFGESWRRASPVSTGVLSANLLAAKRGKALDLSEMEIPVFSRVRLLGVGAVIILLGAIALDTTVVRIGSERDVRQHVFNPDNFGKSQFPTIRDNVIERAVSAQKLVSELEVDKKTAMAAYGTPSSIGAYMPVRLTAKVGEGKSGIFELTVKGLPQGIRIRVQTGPAINGTELRDIPGDIIFGDFKNQIEFQDAGAGINRAMAENVLAGLDRDNLTGKTIKLVGVFNLINPKNWFITPVELTVE